MASVYAIQVVDSSSAGHYSDTRASNTGGLGKGSVQFALDANKNVLQIRLSPTSPWIPNSTSGGDAGAALVVSAGRLTTGIDLSGGILDGNNRLDVTQFASAVTTSIDQETLSGIGGLLVDGGGVLKLGGGNSFQGGIVLAGATVELTAAGAAGTGSIAFQSGTVSTLQLDTNGVLSNALSLLDVGDKIDLRTLTYGVGGATLSGGTLHVTAGAGSANFTATAASRVSSFTTANDGSGGTLLTAACFAEGTRIRTAAGEVAVEWLRVGDRALTVSGVERDIIWIGHRTLDLRRHKRPQDVMPVRVQAHAFGPELPSHTLVLSPDHAVFVAGHLIPIRYLLNGGSVAQEAAETVTYWHVELAAHDVILAEGLPVESYLETGNRHAFENGGGAMSLHPSFAREAWEGACAPLATDGPVVRLVREALIERLGPLGYIVTDDAGLQILCGGTVLQPSGHEGWLRVRLPFDGHKLLLASRSAAPAQLQSDCIDWRRLGVALIGLRIDGMDMPLDDSRLGEGWFATEPGLRWTDGRATLSATPGSLIELRIAQGLRYLHLVANVDVLRLAS